MSDAAKRFAAAAKAAVAVLGRREARQIFNAATRLRRPVRPRERRITADELDEILGGDFVVTEEERREFLRRTRGGRPADHAANQSLLSSVESAVARGLTKRAGVREWLRQTGRPPTEVLNAERQLRRLERTKPKNKSVRF